MSYVGPVVHNSGTALGYHIKFAKWTGPSSSPGRGGPSAAINRYLQDTSLETVRGTQLAHQEPILHLFDEGRLLAISEYNM
jgi:hypothetical protein